MVIKASNFAATRRQFLKSMLPAGTMFCLGCSSLFAMNQDGEQSEVKTEKHKFLEDSEMTFTEVFRFTFQNYYIPSMQSLADEIGREKFIEMLKRVTSERVEESVRKGIENLPKNDFATFISISKKRKNRFVRHVLTDEVLEETDAIVRTRITECLWAKIFRENEASDIGYAAICYPDFAMTRAFNPKIKLIRSKTIMQGHDYCDFHYIWEG